MIIAIVAMSLGTLAVAGAVLSAGPSEAVGNFSGEGPPYQLAVTVQPAASTAAGSPFSLKVSVEDMAGNVDSSDASTTVMLSIAPGTGSVGAALQCVANPTTDSSGVASFACSINAAGTGYQLLAEASGLVSATSTPFDISSGTATKLALLGQIPSKWIAGKVYPVRVAVEDASSDTVTTSTASISLTISSNGNAFKCSVNPVVPSQGVATFECAMAQAGSAYRVAATSPGLATARSSVFSVAASRAAKLEFVHQPPGHARVGVYFSFTVAVADRYGNVVGTSRAEVSTFLAGGRAGSLVCRGNPVRAAAGRSRFVCKVIHAGRNLHLRALSPGATRAVSSPFSIV